MSLTYFSFILLISIHYANSERSCYYACNCDECDATLTTQQCLNDDDYCYSAKEESGNLSKGCVSSELGESFCKELNSTQCWLCVGDFCNSLGSRATSSIFLLATLYIFLRYML
ncbi:hypothetical protein Zmor_023370 [Zophobas morio]|uniref:Uncharacterized protein n=1 Tax=Zophobas morio TaxID=2755281 RepID=A0AA38I2Z0_9CUCU|nr:hypothetical protein Zmor_023370 [Zophobas morio]